MRRVALVFLATVLWLGSLHHAQAQSRMGGQCAGHSASSSSSMSMNNSPGSSAFTGNGSVLNNGTSFGLGTSSMMGGGFGSNLNFATANGMSGGFNPYASANAFGQGGYGFGGFDTGYGMGAMNGQSYAQAAMNDNRIFGNSSNDLDAAAMRAAYGTSSQKPRTTSKSTKAKSRPKSKR